MSESRSVRCRQIAAAIKRRKRIGRRGERIAARLLKSKGYRIIDRNVEMSRGEIDIIALDGRTLVFVEVKTRSRDLYRPSSGWSIAQRKRLLLCAGEYGRRTYLSGLLIRMELVEVTLAMGFFCKRIIHRTADPLPVISGGRDFFRER